MNARDKRHLEIFLKGLNVMTCPDKDQQVLEKALDRFRRNKQNVNSVSLWRIIVNNPIARVAAVLLLTGGITVMSWQSLPGRWHP